MCIRDRIYVSLLCSFFAKLENGSFYEKMFFGLIFLSNMYSCLLYTSDAADERSSVDLGGRRIIKKKKDVVLVCLHYINK